MLTQARLKELLSYDHETGVWTRLVSRPGRGGRAGSIAGNVQPNGYVRLSIESERYLSSRLAFLYMTGEWPAGDVDHRDRNPSNNRWDNLRAATVSQNMANSLSHNQLGVKGVHARGNAFRAMIRVDGRLKSLGSFPTIELAKTAYLDAARQYFGDFARAA